MSEYSVTKQVLAYSVKHLMKQNQLHKITVGDICEECGINRKSFYYHFHDKYDLVNWVFAKDYLQDCERNRACLPADHLLRLCLFVKKNGEFCKNVLEGETADSFSRYLQTMIRPVVEERMRGSVDHDPDAGFFIDMITGQYCGCIVNWLKGGCQTDPERLVRMMYRAVRLGSKTAPEIGLANDGADGEVIHFPAVTCGTN